MLTVIMLNIVNAECHKEAILLSVVMLNVFNAECH